MGRHSPDTSPHRVNGVGVAAAALAVVGTVIPGGADPAYADAAHTTPIPVATGEHTVTLRTVAPDPLTLPLAMVPVPQVHDSVNPVPSTTDGTRAPETAPVAQSAPVPQVTAQPVPPVPPPTEDSTFGARVVALAATFAGIPYSYGGATPREGFDCSGLVQYVFRQLGVSVPRTAQAQYDASTHVSFASMKVGDLVFFGNPGAIYHVGIYAGDNRMWVAPRSGKTVELESIWTSAYHVGRFG